LKWLFQQFLESPSWRLTYPIRWVAKEFRLVRDQVLNRKPPAGEPPSDRVEDKTTVKEKGSTEVAETSFDLKRLFTDLYRIQLQSFLTSGALLHLPQADNPEISVLLVLYNRAELTFACLRALAENYSERIEIVIVDNTSRDETALLLDRLHGV